MPSAREKCLNDGQLAWQPDVVSADHVGVVLCSGHPGIEREVPGEHLVGVDGLTTAIDRNSNAWAQVPDRVFAPVKPRQHPAFETMIADELCRVWFGTSRSDFDAWKLPDARRHDDDEYGGESRSPPCGW